MRAIENRKLRADSFTLYKTTLLLNKVLIIDDEEKLRSLLARLIKLEGFSVNEAANLKQAFKTVAREEPDVILCDVKLPMVMVLILSGK